MPSKMKSMLDTQAKQRGDYSKIEQDKMVEVGIYRPATTGTRPGFDDAVGDYALVGTINARIDPWSGARFRSIRTPSGVATELLYVGMTLDKRYGFKDTDEWRVGTIKYQIIAHDDLEENVEILLKRLQ